MLQAAKAFADILALPLAVGAVLLLVAGALRLFRFSSAAVLTAAVAMTLGISGNSEHWLLPFLVG